MFNKLKLIIQEFERSIKNITDIRSLEKVRVKFLGKNGIIPSQIKKIPDIPSGTRKEFGKEVNEFKNIINKKILSVKDNIISKISNQELLSESIDVTLTRNNFFKRGKIHPISHTINEVSDIFHSMGFDYITGPDIENDWNNFTALNIKENHPSRDIHDTFYIKNHFSKNGVKENTKLLRTHTSPVQIRHMLKNKPPIKVFSIGKVYRSDYDQTHTPMFHQLECLFLDKQSNILVLRSLIKLFLELFFNNILLPIRFRASYFPFTVPSFEVDIKSNKTSKKNTILDSESDWLEILGCGMINKKVLDNVKIDSRYHQGFAFGVGIERLAMLKYNIPDLRYFFENDMRWLDYYGF